ncbi:MAG TPA: gluconokinase [Pyrinomonadaceae bacterium]
MNRQLILGLDIGTSSVRAALFDLNGRLIPKTFVKNERSLRSTRDGGAEIDAELAFRQIVRCVDDVLANSENSRSEIIAVTASAFWHSLLGVDKKGKPTTNVLGWADNRSHGFVGDLRKRLNEHDVHQRTGARFHSSFWLAKLVWFRHKQPDVFARTASWLSISDYVAMRLSGDNATSISMASATGLFNQRKCTWDDELARFLKIKPTDLPPIADASDHFRLNKAFSRRWPRLSGTKWFPAIGDGAANNIGSGCVSKHKAALMVGTSGAFRVAYRGEPPKKIPSGLWCYRIDRGRVVLGGALSDGGGLYDRLNHTVRLPSKAERIIAKRPPAAHGLTVLPFFGGERSTGYHENARGAVLGLTSMTDAIDIAQAAMEAVGYRFADIFEHLNEAAEINEIYASGGALRSSTVWTQIIADILGREISLVDVPEASLRGAVLLALETLGNIESIEQVSLAVGRIFEPNTDNYAVYQRALRQHKRYYDLIINNH